MNQNPLSLSLCETLLSNFFETHPELTNGRKTTRCVRKILSHYKAKEINDVPNSKKEHAILDSEITDIKQLIRKNVDALRPSLKELKNKKENKICHKKREPKLIDLIFVTHLFGFSDQDVRLLHKRIPDVTEWPLHDLERILMLSDTEFNTYEGITESSANLCDVNQSEADIKKAHIKKAEIMDSGSIIDTLSSSSSLCPQCKIEANIVSKQVRSGDEGMTYFADCPQCRRKWILN